MRIRLLGAAAATACPSPSSHSCRAPARGSRQRTPWCTGAASRRRRSPSGGRVRQRQRCCPESSMPRFTTRLPRPREVGAVHGRTGGRGRRAAGGRRGEGRSDVLATRVPAQAGAVATAYSAFISGIPDPRPRRTAWPRVPRWRPRSWGCAPATTSTTWSRTSSQRRAREVFEPIAPTTPMDVKLVRSTCRTFEVAVPTSAIAPIGLLSGEYASSFDEVKASVGTTPPRCAPSRPTRCASTPTRHTSRGAAASRTRAVTAARPARIGSVARARTGRRGRLRRSPAGRQSSTTTSGGRITRSACGHGRQPQADKDATWSHLVTGNHPEYPSGQLRDRGVTETIETYFHSDEVPLTIESFVFTVSDPRQARATTGSTMSRGRRRRPCLGRPPLPEHDEGEHQARQQDRRAHGDAPLPRGARERLTEVGRSTGCWVDRCRSGGRQACGATSSRRMYRGQALTTPAPPATVPAPRRRSSRAGRADPLRPHDVPAGRRDLLPLPEATTPAAVEEVCLQAELGGVRIVPAIESSRPRGYQSRSPPPSPFVTLLLLPLSPARAPRHKTNPTIQASRVPPQGCPPPIKPPPCFSSSRTTRPDGRVERFLRSPARASPPPGGYRDGMRELIGDSARGVEFALVRLRVDGDRIVDADADGLAQDLRGLTLLEAAAVGGETLAVDALANALGPVVRAAATPDRVAVAMSGGVDCAVALLAAGPGAVGVTLRLWIDPEGPDVERACCSPGPCSRRGARATSSGSRTSRSTCGRRSGARSSSRSSAATRAARRRTRASAATAASGSRSCSRSRAGSAPRGSRPATTPASSSTRPAAARPRRRREEGPVLHARPPRPARARPVWFPLGEQTKAETRGAGRGGRARGGRARREPGGLLPRRRRLPRLPRAARARPAPGRSSTRTGRGSAGTTGFWRFTPGQRRASACPRPSRSTRSAPSRGRTRSWSGRGASLATTRVAARGRLFVPATARRGEAPPSLAGRAADVVPTSGGFRLELDEPAYGVARPGRGALRRRRRRRVGLVTSARGRLGSSPMTSLAFSYERRRLRRARRLPRRRRASRWPTRSSAWAEPSAAFPRSSRERRTSSSP